MTKNRKSSILTIYDFSDVANSTVTHAAKFAQLCNQSLVVLNLLDTKTLQTLKGEKQPTDVLKTKLKSLCDEISKTYTIEVSSIIKKAKTTSIQNIAHELGSTFIFTGIDNPQENLKNTLKLINSTTKPLYMVKKENEWRDIKTILIPIDDFAEARQKALYAIRIARQTNASVKLFSKTLKDKGLQKTQEVRVKQIEKKFIEYDIPYTTTFAKRLEKDYAEELMDFATHVNADITILMKTPMVFFENTFMNKNDKKILFHFNHTPLVFINPKDIKWFN